MRQGPEEISADELGAILSGKTGKKRTLVDSRTQGMKKIRLHQDTISSGHSSPSNTVSLNKVRECLPTESAVRLEVKKALEFRNKCTLLVQGLPLKISPSMLDELVPNVRAYRISRAPYLSCFSVRAFLEFSSESDALENREKLHNHVFQNQKLTARTGSWMSVNVDDYDCKKLVLHGLHYKTGRGEIARRFPACTNIELQHVVKCNRRKPRVAYLTFPLECDALKAFKEKQGCKIRGRKISVTFYSISNARKITEKKCLVIRGLKKSVSESDIRAVFPQAKSISVNYARGDARLLYDLEEDCILDHDNAKGISIKNHKIQMSFVPHKSKSDDSVSERISDQKNMAQTTNNDGVEKSSGILVDKFNPSVSEKELWSFCPKARRITLLKGKKTTGRALIELPDSTKAKRIISSLKEKTIKGQTPRLRLATPKRLRLFGMDTDLFANVDDNHQPH